MLAHEVEVEVVRRARSRGRGDDLVVGELARGLADEPLLVGQLEVHGGTLSRLPRDRWTPSWPSCWAGVASGWSSRCSCSGVFYPGSGAEVLDWNPTRSPELEAQNEIDDLEQMREAANRRRRRGARPS